MTNCARYISRPFYLPWSNNPSNTEWRVKIMKLIIQFSPSSCYFSLNPIIFFSRKLLSCKIWPRIVWWTFTDNEEEHSVCLLLIAWFFLRHWRRKQYYPPKCWETFKTVHDGTSQKTILFLVPIERTLNSISVSCSQITLILVLSLR
jgi:hypothetical protein